MPFELWPKGPLNDIMEDALSSESVQKRGLFDAVTVQRIKTQFYRGRVSWAQIWLLMIIELWCREVLDTLPTTQNVNLREVMAISEHESYQSIKKTKILFLAWGYSIHAQRRIQIFVDDPLFDVTVVSTYNYRFSGATTIPLSGVKTPQKTGSCHDSEREYFSRASFNIQSSISVFTSL